MMRGAGKLEFDFRDVAGVIYSCHLISNLLNLLKDIGFFCVHLNG